MITDQMPSPTALLREEHQLILAVAAVLDRVLAVEVPGGPPGIDTVDRCVTFFRLFADACHHAKEENILFPALEACGMSPDSGPVGVMLGEHEQGRALVRSMGELVGQARDGDRDAEPALRTAASGFVELITSHIAKEDGILFDMADQLIQGPACDALCAAYAELADERYEGHSKQDLVDLAGEILGVG
ncbi:MAG: hemerythrin domain-containing protein [Acidimicrobiales bacterium]|nr:hemerythrin [Actinomycetota bacterium]MDP6062190.1 hemerythrin domain-containing protein [Acidimicrobiales bacterium]MDP7208527.1 hemerythrin domain-containing protein [Acidimicrobiales bacterium]